MLTYTRDGSVCVSSKINNLIKRNKIKIRKKIKPNPRPPTLKASSIPIKPLEQFV